MSCGRGISISNTSLYILTSPIYIYIFSVGGGFPSFRVTEFPSFGVSELSSFRVSKFPSLQRREGGRTNERPGTDHVI